MQNIIDSVNSSSRTIIILSSAFLSSQWAQAEFDEAYVKRKVICILKTSDLESVKDKLPQHPSIKNYVETFTYLRDDDPNFWPKLIYRLPHKHMKKKQRESRRTRHPTEMQELVRNTSRESN